MITTFALWFFGSIFVIAFVTIAWVKGWIKKPSKKTLLWLLAIAVIGTVGFMLYSHEWKRPDWHFHRHVFLGWLQAIPWKPWGYWILEGIGAILLLLILNKYCSRALGRFAFWLAILATSGAIFIGCYWAIQKINQGIPEKMEFTAYYQYWIEYPDGSMRNGDQILVRVTPDGLGSGYRTVDGASETLRWTRGGDGVWTRIHGQKTEASWLKISNVSSNKLADFEEWHRKILGVTGDSDDPNKKYKITLVR